MVNAALNQSWIGRDMIVTSSPDAALIGRNGLVVDETRETITMLENDREVILGKNSIEFKIGSSDATIKGMLVRQRSEDRIYRNKWSE
ncbi:MAG: ribonuclease P protein subunit [Candidatus Poseidoniaceae archaeon]|mgnify:CR=1 FL=1|jgi:RNase P/RNase MRP subunit p29|nr:ribonuclease P protein subunit [Candidatus Poseidoniaceae archaeon]|tara:strand:- start:1133 stop:1396 length:264 start_codon:yes stop_codon:yes gene_type:complete